MYVTIFDFMIEGVRGNKENICEDRWEKTETLGYISVLTLHVSTKELVGLVEVPPRRNFTHFYKRMV